MDLSFVFNSHLNQVGGGGSGTEMFSVGSLMVKLKELSIMKMWRRCYEVLVIDPTVHSPMIPSSFCECLLRTNQLMDLDYKDEESFRLRSAHESAAWRANISLLWDDYECTAGGWIWITFKDQLLLKDSDAETGHLLDIRVRIPVLFSLLFKLNLAMSCSFPVRWAQQTSEQRKPALLHLSDAWLHR